MQAHFETRESRCRNEPIDEEDKRTRDRSPKRAVERRHTYIFSNMMSIGTGGSSEEKSICVEFEEAGPGWLDDKVLFERVQGQIRDAFLKKYPKLTMFAGMWKLSRRARPEEAVDLKLNRPNRVLSYFLKYVVEEEVLSICAKFEDEETLKWYTEHKDELRKELPSPDKANGYTVVFGDPLPVNWNMDIEIKHRIF